MDTLQMSLGVIITLVAVARADGFEVFSHTERILA